MKSQPTAAPTPMRRVVPILLVFAVMPVLAGPTERDDAAREVAIFRAVTFTAVKSVAVAKIESAKEHPLLGLLREDFHGYYPTSNWHSLDGDMAAKVGATLGRHIAKHIAALLDANGDAVLSLIPFCIPRPGYAIRIETDQGRRDFVVCLECHYVVAYGADAKPVEFWPEESENAVLKKSYEQVFLAAPNTIKR